MRFGMNEEQILQSNKLYYLLCWRLNNATNTHLLEASAEVLYFVLSQDELKKTITTVIPSLTYLFSLFFSVYQKTECITAIKLIELFLSYNHEISVPCEFIDGLLNRCILDMFKYDLIFTSLRIVQILVDRDTSLLHLNQEILSKLQHIYYGTHSYPCRTIISSIVSKSNPSMECVAQEDNIDIALLSATIHQLSSSNPSVVSEAVKICFDAFILYHDQFLIVFKNEIGLSIIIQSLRRFNDYPDDVIHSLLQLLITLYESQAIEGERELLPLVVVLYNIMKKKESSTKCIHSILSLLCPLSSHPSIIARVANNIDLLSKLLMMYSVSDSTDQMAVSIITHLVSLLSLFANNTPNGLLLLKEKKVSKAVDSILSQIEDSAIITPCFRLFLLLHGEQHLHSPCSYLIQPCWLAVFHNSMISIEESAQILVILRTILTHDNQFALHPIHKSMLYMIGALGNDRRGEITEKNEREILLYLNVLVNASDCATFLQPSGVLLFYIHYLQQEPSRMREEFLLLITSLFTKSAGDCFFVRYTLHSHLQPFLQLLETFIKDEAIVLALISLISAITSAEDFAILTKVTDIIQQAYPTNHAVQEAVESLVHHCNQPEQPHMTSSLEEAIVLLLSSTEKDIQSHMDIVQQLVASSMF